MGALEEATRSATPGRGTAGQTTAIRQGLDRKPSQAWATKMLPLTMPKNAETISIIATVLYALRRGNGMAGRTVKTIQSGQPLRGTTDDFRNKDCLKGTDRRRGRLRGDIRTQAEAAAQP